MDLMSCALIFCGMECLSYRVEFGKGLANGGSWPTNLLATTSHSIDLQHKSQRDVSVIRGFIEET